MRKRAAAGVVTAIGLMVAAVAACRSEASAAALVKHGSFGSLPRESVGLIVLDVKALRGLGKDAPWARDLAALGEDDGPIRQVRDRFGDDLLRRVERLALAVVPRPENGVAYAIVIEGRYDSQTQARIREALAGQPVVTLAEAEGKSDFSVTQLEGGSLAVGPRVVLDIVRGNAAKGEGGVRDNALILDLLGKVRPTSHIWGAIDCRTLTALARDFARAQGSEAALASAPQIHSLVSLAFQGTIGRTVEFDVQGEADAEGNARTLAEALRGLVALARVGAGQDGAQEWLEFLDGMKIDQSGTSLSVRGSIPEKTMAALAGRASASPLRTLTVDPGAPPPAPAPPGPGRSR